MGVHDPLGHGQFGSQGLDRQDLCRGPLNIATYKIYKLWTSCFQRRRFFKFFSHFKSMGSIYRHGGHLDLRIVTIFTNFQFPFNTRLHIKLEEIWPRGFRGEVVQMCEWTDNGRRTENDHNSSSWTKNNLLFHENYRRQFAWNVNCFSGDNKRKIQVCTRITK